MVTGFLGPASDSEMQRAASFHTNPRQHFSDGEFLFGDKGFFSTTEVAVPYKGALAMFPENANYNALLARVRVRTEQFFGPLKEIHSSREQLRVQFHEVRDVNRAFDCVISTLALHNICILTGDYKPPSNR